MPKPKTAWQELHDAILSIALVTEAGQLNRTRLAERRQQRPEALLPSHLKADPGRMKRVLQALHRRLGSSARGDVTLRKLCSDLGCGPDTIRRALRDLEELQLVERTTRVLGHGGNGGNEYRICRGNVMDLAHRQGLQRSLRFEEADCSASEVEKEEPRHEAAAGAVIAGSDRPDAPSGRNPSGAGTGVAPCAPPLAPCDPPLAPCEGGGRTAAGSLVDPRAHARADASSPSSRFNLSSSSLPVAASRRREEEDSWRLVEGRLRRLGLTDARETWKAAAARNWTAAQVSELLDSIEARTINGAIPWRSIGIVWRHLRATPAGTPLATPRVPTEAWQRERSARESRERQARDLREQQRCDSEAREASVAVMAAAEEAVGTLLDALQREEALDLVSDPNTRREIAKRWLPDAPVPARWRGLLLLQLQAHLSGRVEVPHG